MDLTATRQADGSYFVAAAGLGTIYRHATLSEVLALFARY